MSNPEVVALNLNQLVIKAKESIKQVRVIALQQAWKILQLATVEIIQNIENTDPNLKGVDKKVLAMNLISDFYDKVFVVVDFPFVPKLLQPIIQKYVKQLLMLLISSSIDALVTTFRNTGIFVDPNQLVDVSVDSVPKISDK
jgi:hypothetical protein